MKTISITLFATLILLATSRIKEPLYTPFSKYSKARQHSPVEHGGIIEAIGLKVSS